MPEYIYRPQVKNGGETITYHNSKGQTVTYKPNDDAYSRDRSFNIASGKSDAALLFNTFKKYFTGNSPNITPEEQVKLRTDIAMNRLPIQNQSNVVVEAPMLDIYEGIDFVLKTFSDEKSEGGKNITPNEVYRIFEIFHQWTK